MSGLLIAFLLGEAFFRIVGLIANETNPKSYENNKNIYKILCVGDSTTYGLGASDPDKFSYPRQLQKILDEKSYQKKFEVINIGVPGINSSQVLNRFRNNILKHKPEVAVIMVGINDPWNLEESNILTFYSGSIFEKLCLNIELLLNKLRLYQFFKLIYITNRMGTSEQGLQLPSFNNEAMSKGFVFSQYDSMRSAALYNAIAYNITQLKLIAENNRVKVIFMTYHNIGWGHPEKIIHQIYTKLEVPIVDNETLFKKAQEKKLSVWGSDGWHPNDLGYLLIAKNVYNKMVSLGFVNGEPLKIFE